MSIHIDQLLLSKKVLLLQGPMGYFFRKFALWLQGYGVETYKINFNGGDRFYFGNQQNVFDFKEPFENFKSWISQFVNQHEIEAIVCFGDCRPLHRVAKEVSTLFNIDFFAFEEGYIRPNYITFEQGGVNFFSNFVDTLSDQQMIEPVNIKPIEETQNSYWFMVCCAIFYYAAIWYFSKCFPHYQHHRNLTTSQESWSWILSLLRRARNFCIEPFKFKRFIQQYSKQYYMFALQVHNDSQILIHSELKSMEEYIEHVIKSFARFSEPEHHLVLKHHPMDRGYRNYTSLINDLSIRYGVVGRTHYFCDIHLPTLLKHSLGMVAVNSTTVLQALYHHIPVKVIGYAMYNLPRLTNQYSLDEFWKKPGVVDQKYFKHYRAALIEYSQLNGSYYGHSPWMQRSYLIEGNKNTHPKELNNVIKERV
ncbi:capsular biosynthesis protein [Acinetobacter shaoyimingii]|uniref:Capsular biosynthesis protein n=1 Tax=Acinetobacter shaoyimingii TaxID=2715164 RepID=A0A6G8RRQ6_9GAMM|nr:capsular biosynthesis protein [Acinetobacter shaoyimingii]QIO04565.1 capsular biosynthesis protein [Acinetobacter shaoyimingii]